MQKKWQCDIKKKYYEFTSLLNGRMKLVEKALQKFYNIFVVEHRLFY